MPDVFVKGAIVIDARRAENASEDVGLTEGAQLEKRSSFCDAWYVAGAAKSPSQ